MSPSLFPRLLPVFFRHQRWAIWLGIAAAQLGTFSAYGAQYDQRLANLSTRGQVGTGDRIMITGFIIQDGAPKQVLVRAMGPRLATAPFSLPGVLMDPTITLFNSSGAIVGSNDNWLSSDAATMTAAGAYPFNAASRDAALVATLSPGVYTAHVSGVGSTTGLTLLEVYDVTGAARLMNLSTRALVGSGANILISGLIVAPGGGIRKVLIRAAGPGLTGLGVAGALSDPVFSVLDNAARVIASNDNWTTADTNGQLTAAFAQSGAFPFQVGSKDAALLVDLPPNAVYTIQVSSIDGSTGLALVEVYDLTPETLTTVGVVATVPSTDASGGPPAVFTFSRLGPTTNPVTLRYSISGSAVAGVDYNALPGSVTLPAGVGTATVTLTPLPNAKNGNNRTLTLTLTSDLSYGIGANDNASATIFSNAGALYVATLRAPVAASNSAASGTATLQLSADEASAVVNVSFSNLSSPETSAHLVIDGNFISGLPLGQVVGATWTLRAVASYTVADLIAAVKSGQVYVSIDTSGYPSGELTGGFVRSTGTAAFNIPAAPPALDLSRPTAQDAAQFLTQGTFGPTSSEISALVQKGYNTWLNEQVALPASLHRTATMADFQATPAGGQNNNTEPGGSHRQAAWWKIAVTGQDQLRQRVAFALSEIFVISDVNDTLNAEQEGAANYYDVLVKGAFGNFRTLLEDVTLSPMMGIYLSTLRNSKAQGTALADENYAREVMQLFTIGRNELQPDGTLKLDSSGQPIPTYTQETIVQTAKVFTGWAFNSTAANPNFRSSAADYINPMMLYPAFHDDTQKTVVGGKVIPAGQGGVKDLGSQLDALFNHANTGPFISRQLIQKLVTSNPSPGYVYRVAQVFANNGAGVRGDLGAVVRAILTDYEARAPGILATPGHGKLKEPLVRATALLRAFGGGSESGRFAISNPENLLAQAALRAPTVFNFFDPDFVKPGALAAAGLYAPEYEILTATTAITVPNFLYTYIYNTRSAANPATIGLKLDDLLALARTPQALVDQLNAVLSAGTIPKPMSDRIVAALAAMPANTADLEKVRSAIYLVVTSPEGAIQK